ncbi:14-3-3 protein domain-containing protein [Ditylenchus destructor]|uniref:14-3-3 protein domain-containing protein n=1 Tax=Ditylenchus destructor TaxID=166010 RepID=A0AAD4MQI7_9BILA|nr:14-3-3 protein domain-containing protein [Ditylenchus destructor]
MSENKDELVQRAKLAYQRYDDMTQLMKKVVELGAELSTEERHLFTIAYNSAVEDLQEQWYSILIAEHVTKGNAQEQLIVKMAQLVTRLHDTYIELLNLLDNNLIPKTGIPENKVFYVKMKADCYAEIAAIGGQYEAFDIAKDKLRLTHPVQLALALRFSQFYYATLNDPEKACQVAQQALVNANAELKDSMNIMQLLCDNLTKWTTDTSTDNQDGAAEAGGN